MILTAAEWKQQVDAQPNRDELTKLIMLVDAQGVKKFPEGDQFWRDDQGWRTLLRIFLVSEHSEENVDFLDALDKYKNQAPGAPTAQELYDTFVDKHSTRQVNLPDRTVRKCEEALAGGEASVFRDAIDTAYDDIVQLIVNDGYPRFRREISEVVQPAWAAVAEAGKAKVGPPQKIDSPQSRPAETTVNSWNERALKDLGENDTTDFLQIGELVIIANAAAGLPPGMGWAQQQAGVVTGTITMTQKGGAFSRGSIRVDHLGLGHRSKFEDAIRIVSKKEITYRGMK